MLQTSINKDYKSTNDLLLNYVKEGKLETIKDFFASIKDPIERENILHFDTITSISHYRCGRLTSNPNNGKNDLAFIEAAKYKHLNILEFFVEQTTDEQKLSKMIHANGNAPFMAAITNNDIETLKFLIKNSRQSELSDMLHHFYDTPMKITNDPQIKQLLRDTLPNDKFYER